MYTLALNPSRSDFRNRMRHLQAAIIVGRQGAGGYNPVKHFTGAPEGLTGKDPGLTPHPMRAGVFW